MVTRGIWHFLPSFLVLFSLQLALGVIEDGKINDQIWEKIFTLNREEKFQEALSILKENQEDTAQYYYNLGSLYLKLSNYGQAVINLERAKSKALGNGPILKNLSIAKLGLGKTIGHEKIDAYSDWPMSWVEYWIENVSRDLSRGLLGVLFGICALVWLRIYWKSRNWKIVLGTYFGMLSVLFCVCIGVFVLMIVMLKVKPTMICTVNQSVRSGPGDRFLEVSQVLVGMKVRISNKPPAYTENGDSWRLVNFGSGGLGWIKEKGLAY